MLERLRHALRLGLLVALAAVLPASARAQDAAGAAPAVADRLVILSTTDVQGKTGPCGCATPKGGFSRRAALADSLRALNPNLLVVDNGGYFPDLADYEPNAVFMLDAMAMAGVQVAGLGDREMQYGRGFLVATLAKARFPVVCTNLWDLQTKKRVAKPWTIVDVGGHPVGVFGLFSKTLGEARTGDSLAVGEPVEAARLAVTELRKAGATLIVLLSSLGKTATEDLVASVDGIDVAVAGRKVPVLNDGRKVKSTVVVYGGDQAHYMGRTDVGFDAKGHVVEAKAVTVALAPEIGENAGMLGIVKAFEDSFNERLHKLQNARAAAAGGAAVDSLASSARQP